jgi:hypothetical protein
VRFLVLLAVMAGAGVQTDNVSSPDRLLEQIKQRAIEDLASVPNYVCVDSIERSLWIPAERQFRRLDRVHFEIAHVEGADRFSWIGDSTFQSKTPSSMVGGAGFGGDFSENRALVFKSNATKIVYAGRGTIDGQPALHFDYDHPGRALGVTSDNQSGWAAARGSFWIDAETLDLLQLNIEGYDIPSNLALQSISDDTRYRRVLIGKRIALLARSSDFHLTLMDGTGRRNASVFSNCREYTAESTLTFSPSPAVPVPPPTVEHSQVPPGLQLQLVLDKTFDVNEAAVGEPILADVLKGEGGIPRGAHVYGRVTRVTNFDDQIPLPAPKHRPPLPKHELWGRHTGEVLIQIEFSQIEYRRVRGPFLARLIDLESQPGKRETDVRSFGYLDDDSVVTYDPLGTASIHVSKGNPVLGRDVIMLWVTASKPGSL